MADKRIDDATEDSVATGIENIPVSDGGVGKRLSVERIKDYVVSQVTAAATTSSVTIADDGVYIRHGNDMNRVAASVFGDAVMAAAFAKTCIVSPNGNEIVAISDSGTEKTIQLSGIRSFVLSDVSSVFTSTTVADAMASTDAFIIKQGSSVKKATAIQVATYVEGRIGAYVNALSDVGTMAITDKLLVSVNGVARSATVASIVSLVQGGYVGGPSTTTENKIPQWSDTTKTLKDGLLVRSTVRESGTASNDCVPTEAAVRSALDSLNAGITVSGTTPTAGNIPVWAGSSSLSNGKSVQNTVRSDLLSTDDAIPTEKSVRTAIDDAASGKVDKVTGKGLSTNDYTTEEKTKLAGITTGADVSPITAITVNGTAVTPVNKTVNVDISGKVDKVAGKGLSTNDYTTAEKTKLAGITTGANVNVQANWTQTNTESDDFIKNKPSFATVATTGLYSDLSDKPNIPADSKIKDWSSSTSYAVGDYCLHDGHLQRCKVAGKVSSYRSSDWEYVPCYPANGGDTTKYLRNDGTWQVPPTSTDFTGATGGSTPAAGNRGLVPAPTTGDVNNFLKGSGGWADPTVNCAKAPSTTTVDNIPQWDETSKTLKDGLVLFKSSSEEIPSSEEDSCVPTVGVMFRSLSEIAEEIEENYVYSQTNPVAGQIPVWDSPTTGESCQHPKRLVNGKSIITSADLNQNTQTTPSDGSIPTYKLVADIISMMNGLAKNEGVFTGTSGTLLNHTAQRFSISTGTNYTLTLPVTEKIGATDAGRSREFYVIFSQSPASAGSEATSSKITFVNPSGESVEIHGKNGVLTNNELTLTWDATGNSNAFHVYHFFEDDSQLWCVNVFDAAESAVASDFTGATEDADGAPGLVPAPSAGDDGCVLMGDGNWGYPASCHSYDYTATESTDEITIYDGFVDYVTLSQSLSAFKLSFDSSSSFPYTMVGTLVVKNTNATVPTITCDKTVVLPQDVSTISDLFAGNTYTAVRFTAMYFSESESVVVAEKIVSVPISQS